MTPKNEIAIPILKLTVGYNPVTGELWWLKRGPHWFTNTPDPEKESKRWNTRYEGRPAFNTKNAYGYLCGRHSGVTLYAHRVMWALHKDEWPYPFLDHINGCRNDNRIVNLRIVDRLSNNRNAKLRYDNKTGFCGVTLDKKSGKFRVNVREGGKQVYLGKFLTLAEASAVAKDYRIKVGYSERHGDEGFS